MNTDDQRNENLNGTWRSFHRAHGIGWREEHPRWVRAIYRALGIGHCGQPGWRTGYQPGEAPRVGGGDRG